ncbi:hypothetical protein GW17_00009489 [Ensete ventricosum]|nr:hypothetical protein GW17_00009489 [Ensete ventricosum]
MVWTVSTRMLIRVNPYGTPVTGVLPPECSVLLDTLEKSACNPEIASILLKSLLRILQLAVEQSLASFKSLDAIARVLKVNGTRTARYRAPKIDRRRPIEEEIDRGRSIEREIDRRRSIEEEKGKKKKKRRKIEAENTSPARRPRLRCRRSRVACTPSPLVAHACALSSPTGRLHAVTARRPRLRPLFSRREKEDEGEEKEGEEKPGVLFACAISLSAGHFFAPRREKERGDIASFLFLTFYIILYRVECSKHVARYRVPYHTVLILVCRYGLQYGLDILQNMLKDSIINRTACFKAGVLGFLLDWFREEDREDMISKIAELIQIIGGHSISGKDIRKIFALLRREKRESIQKHRSLLLTSIRYMLKEKGPEAFFEFNGCDSIEIGGAPIGMHW